MGRQRIHGVRLSLHGRHVPAETLALGIAGDVLVLSTTVPSRGVTIHSTYHGHAGLQTQIVHLDLVPGEPHRELASRPHEELPVLYARERCLLDHLAHVRDVLDSGDVRMHGRKTSTAQRLAEAGRGADVLLLEGTRALDDERERVTEADVEARLVELANETEGILLVGASAQNVDRLVSMFRAARRSGRQLVVDLYAEAVLRGRADPLSRPRRRRTSVSFSRRVSDGR